MTELNNTYLEKLLDTVAFANPDVDEHKIKISHRIIKEKIGYNELFKRLDKCDDVTRCYQVLLINRLQYLL